MTEALPWLSTKILAAPSSACSKKTLQMAQCLGQATKVPLCLTRSPPKPSLGLWILQTGLRTAPVTPTHPAPVGSKGMGQGKRQARNIEANFFTFYVFFISSGWLHIISNIYNRRRVKRSYSNEQTNKTIITKKRPKRRVMDRSSRIYSILNTNGLTVLNHKEWFQNSASFIVKLRERGLGHYKSLIWTFPCPWAYIKS